MAASWPRRNARDRRVWTTDRDRHAVVFATASDLLDQIVAKQVRPRDGRGIGAGGGHAQSKPVSTWA